MNFIKTSVWASLTTGLNIISGFLTTKIIAIKLGPEGVALMGQFSNFTVLLTLFATAACSNGVIKFLSETDNEHQKRKILENVFLIVAVASGLVIFFTVIFSSYLSYISFNSNEYFKVYLLFGCAVFFTGINAITIAALNGLRLIKEMSLFSISISLINLIFVLISSYLFDITGVLLANAVANVAAYMLYYRRLKQLGLAFRVLKNAYDFILLKGLLRFSVMAIVSGVIAPLIQIFVRTRLMKDYGFSSAGVWQATSKLSDYYLNFIYAVLGIYFLPKLSSLNEKKKIQAEIKWGYIRILPIVILLAILIWILRDFIIKVAFTHEFNDVVLLLKWQLIGDVVKVSSFILGYLVIAKGLVKSYIAIEIVFAVLFVILSAWMINVFGIVGSVYAFALNYFLYFLTLIIFLRRYIFIK